MSDALANLYVQRLRQAFPQSEPITNRRQIHTKSHQTYVLPLYPVVSGGCDVTSAARNIMTSYAACTALIGGSTPQEAGGARRESRFLPSKASANSYV